MIGRLEDDTAILHEQHNQGTRTLEEQTNNVFNCLVDETRRLYEQVNNWKHCGRIG